MANISQQRTQGKRFDLPPPIYTILARDRKIRHQAFRLWHYLRTHMNAHGWAWPEQRTIAAAIGCKPHSLKGWTEELCTQGYLRTEKRGKNHQLYYSFWPCLEKVRVAPTGNTKNPVALPLGDSRVALWGSRGVVPTGNRSKTKNQDLEQNMGGAGGNVDKPLPFFAGIDCDRVEDMKQRVWIGRRLTEAKEGIVNCCRERGDLAYKRVSHAAKEIVQLEQKLHGRLDHREALLRWLCVCIYASNKVDGLETEFMD